MSRKTFDEVVLNARTGLNPRNNFKLGNGDNKYITIKNIHNNEIIIDENTDVVDDDAIELIHKRSQIKKGDILFCSIGRMGDMYIIQDEPKGWDINESVFAFTVDTNIVRQKYFYYVFKNHDTIEYLSKNSSGSTFKSIKMNQLKKMVFDLPSLGEQDRIVDILDTMSLIIKNREDELKRHDELVKARFVELFGDPETNSLGWSEACIGDNCFVTKLAGFEYTKYITYADSGDVVMVKAQNVKNGSLNRKDLSFISNEVSDSLPRSQLAPGDVVMTYVGANIGDVAIIDNEYKYHLAPNVAKIRPDADKYNSEFFMYMLMMKTDYIMRNSADTAKAALGMERIRKLKVFVPDLLLQNQFADFVKQVDKSKVAVQKALDETQMLFDSLMQEFFG